MADLHHQIFAGDLNYRIGLNHEKVHSLIKVNDLGTLYQHDQLNLQMLNVSDLEGDGSPKDWR